MIIYILPNLIHINSFTLLHIIYIYKYIPLKATDNGIKFYIKILEKDI